MRPLNKKLKIKLLLLSLVFPLSFSFIGFIEGLYSYNNAITILLAFAGLIIGILLNFICYHRKLFTIALYQTPIPLAIVLLVWWISNPFMSDLNSLFFAIGGLLIGLWLNKELILPYQFYKIKKRILALVYLFFSIVTLGYFIGIPAFNILLGFFAGNYLSIRAISNYKIERQINKDFKQGAAYTSLILFIITAFAFIMAFSDIEHSIKLTNQILGIPINKTFFIVLTSLGGIFIVILQYFITLFTARTMLQLWKHKRFNRYVTH